MLWFFHGSRVDEADEEDMTGSEECDIVTHIETSYFYERSDTQVYQNRNEVKNEIREYHIQY